MKEHNIDRYSNYKKNFDVKRLFKKIWPTECRDLSYRLLKKFSNCSEHFQLIQDNKTAKNLDFITKFKDTLRI